MGRLKAFFHSDCTLGAALAQSFARIPYQTFRAREFQQIRHWRRSDLVLKDRIRIDLEESR